jgi:glutathione reductase (NADPH)
MWNAVEIARMCDIAGDYGFELELKRHDFGVLKSSRDAYVNRLNDIYATNLDKNGIRHVAQAGKIIGPGEVAAGAERFAAPHIIIATGGKPVLPEIPGAELGIDSDRFFELDSAPSRTAIVGSGYIAVELAGVLNALGSSVTIFARRNRLLRSFDEMLSLTLMDQMRTAGIEVVTGAVPTAVRSADGLSIETEASGTFAGFDSVLFAIGRAPNTAQLGLDTTRVVLRQSGHVVVDDFQNTAEAGIYAIGDVTGQAELTPVAIAAGRRLADRIFGGQSDRKLSYDVVPTVIFSHPPIGTIGLSEEAASERFGSEVRIYTSSFVGMLHAFTSERPKTSMKLVTVGDEQRVVGCHVIGAGADEMMQGFAVAMSLGATKRDFDDTIAIHPTSAEELVTMR